MASTINADNGVSSGSAGLKSSADSSGVLQLQTNGTAAITISTGQVATFAQAPVLPAASIPQAALASGVAGTGPAFSARPSTTQSVTTATYTKVNLGTENFDTNNNFASSRFTPTVAGYYQLNGSVYPVSTNSANYIWAFIYKNGATYASGSSAGAASTQDGISVVSTLVYLNGSTDYVELYCYVTGTSPVIQNDLATQFSGFLARGA